MSFKDKVVVVTGASSGIGAATAVAYAKAGAKLVLNGRNEDRLKRTATLCEGQGLRGDNVHLVIGDLTNEEVCNRLIDEAVDKFGCLDVLVNNAGSGVKGNIDTTTVQDVERQFRILAAAAFMTSKRAIPHLRKSKGNIVNVSSVAASVPFKSAISYSMAKAALSHFTKCLAQDVAPSGVRVNSIKPGVVDTEILVAPGGFIEGKPEEKPALLAEMAKAMAMNRVGHVDEVAQTILFVSSEAASFMTGSEIVLDGGFTGKNAF